MRKPPSVTASLHTSEKSDLRLFARITSELMPLSTACTRFKRWICSSASSAR